MGQAQQRPEGQFRPWENSQVHIHIDFIRLFKDFFYLGLLLQRAQALQSRPTLCDPMDHSPPGSSVLGISPARILEWLAMPSSKGIFLILGSNPHHLCHLHCRRILYVLNHREAPSFVL